MSEQGTTKDQVSLEDLKRAIDAVGHDHPYLEYSALELLAWRAAFHWLREIHEDLCVTSEEYAEGMRLIQEKLG